VRFLAGAALDEDGVPLLEKSGDREGIEPDPVLVMMGFPGNSDDHADLLGSCPLEVEA